MAADYTGVAPLVCAFAVGDVVHGPKPNGLRGGLALGRYGDRIRSFSRGGGAMQRHNAL